MNDSPITLPCLCATLRRAARAVTSSYDEALRPYNLTITQFTVLQTLKTAGAVSQSRLGEILAIDSTTLSRTLKPLVEAGLVNRGAGADRRAWSFSLSLPGSDAYEAAVPAWDAVQTILRRQIGRESWSESFRMADAVTTAALRSKSNHA